MLRDYTARELTKPDDRLPALAGLATKFSEKTGDVCVNSLWMHGMPEGLLWHSVGLGWGEYDQRSTSRSPKGLRAPTWSWASLDGRVSYPIGKLVYIDAQLEGFTIPKSKGRSSGVVYYEDQGLRLFSEPDQLLILRAILLPLSEFVGFRTNDIAQLKQEQDSQLAYRMPHVRFDDPDREIDDLDGVFALFIGQVGCGSKDCDRFADCRYGWAYCLLLEPFGESSGGAPAFVCLGLAQCYSFDFANSSSSLVVIR